MAGRNAGRISACHQRTSLRHPQQKADRRRRTGDSLSRRRITTGQTIGCVAVCMSDAPDWPMWDRVTTDLVYIRLHGHTRKYASSYSKLALNKWATHIRGWLNKNRSVHVYFDNDAEGAAPKNALTLLEILR